MIQARSLTLPAVVVGLWLAAACEQTLRTGKVGNKTQAPAADGSCPTGLVACGTGAFARCVDLQDDREHCGECATVCATGIPCAVGACQQVACSAPVTVSAQTVPSPALGGSPSSSGTLLADVNGDGRLDLVTWWLNGDYPAANGTFEVALGEAGGTFGAAASYVSANRAAYIVAADSNSDGFDDLYVGDGASGLPCLQIWLGHRDGKLTPRLDRGDAGCRGVYATGDLNGDGMMDLVSGKIPPFGGTVYLADANGKFHVGIDVPSQRTFSNAVVLDWNGDGLPDLVALSNLSIYLNQGNGRFGDEMACGVYTDRVAMAIVDFDHDGRPDVATSLGGSIGVVLGMGGCQFQPMTEYRLPGPVVALAHGDLDGDRNEDLVARTREGTVSLLRGAGDGTFLVAPLGFASECIELCDLHVGDVTGDGRLDVLVAAGTGPTRIDIVPDAGISVTVTAGVTQVLQNNCP